MTQEQKRIKIAEACGWKIYKYGVSRPHESFVIYSDALDGIHALVPDYINDLNAMHEAEKVLSEPQRLAYVRELVLVCEPHLRGVIFGLDAGRGWWLAHATSAQRAEAFGRVKGLWE